MIPFACSAPSVVAPDKSPEIFVNPEAARVYGASQAKIPDGLQEVFS